MIYAIPVVGWLIDLFLHISLAVPFWICWNALAEKFFYFLPPVYHHIGFWETVGLFITLSVLKLVLVPRGVVSAKSESKGTEQKK